MASPWDKFGRLNAALVIAAFLVLVCGISAVTKVMVDRLLYWDAAATAESWARYVLQNVKDVARIANGGIPSSQSMDFLVGSQRVRHVFAFEIIDLVGNVQLVSDGMGIVNVGGSQHDPVAARAAALGQTIVEILAGEPPVRPLVYSVAYVPLTSGGSSRAVVAAFIDLTEKQAQFRSQFITAALSLWLITGAALAFPVVGWYRRTREKERADEHIRFLARHDALTGLANRTTFIEGLSQLLSNKTRLALHFVDLDRFKMVNDTLGHDMGDTVIKATAEQLRSIAGPDGLVARYGGDEFAVVQLDPGGAEGAEKLAREIVKSLGATFAINVHRTVVTASVGVALAPDHGEDGERLLKCADLALYKSKAEGRECVRIFTPEMDEEFQSRIELEQTLRNATANERFSLHFQPIYALPRRALIGYEALLRLSDENGKPISPALFVPVAEDIGLIDTIGTWVIREACRTAANWPDPLKIAVNLSPAQFASGSVYGTVLDALGETGLAPHRLELEITESLLLREDEHIIQELGRLKQAGIAIVMDDFGTGYSSLSYLWRFPFDKIKIDRGFMTGLQNDVPQVETIIRTIVALGHSLNMLVNAEGVETEQQVEFVSNIACDQAQGFHLGRPRPAADVAADILAEFRRSGQPRQPALVDTLHRAAG